MANRLREFGEAGLVEHPGDGYVLTAQGKTLVGHLGRLDEWAAGWKPTSGGHQ